MTNKEREQLGRQIAAALAFAEIEWEERSIIRERFADEICERLGYDREQFETWMDVARMTA